MDNKIENIRLPKTIWWHEAHLEVLFEIRIESWSRFWLLGSNISRSNL